MIFICQMTGVVGSVFTYKSIPTWYSTLIKPEFSPPNFVFGPVWITLYTLMGIAIYLIYADLKSSDKKYRKEIEASIQLFWVQLGLNGLWSVLFFGLRSPLLGLIDIVVLLIMITVVTYRFWHINQKASLLMIPYLAWVLLATILNFSIWRLNS